MNPRTDTSTASIDADPDHVWRVLADEFLDNAAWAPGVISSVANPATPMGVNGSPYGGRISEITGLGRADVRIVDYDAQARTLSYTLEAENIPPFIERLQNTWTVARNGGHGCTVVSELAVTVADAMSDNDQANRAVAGMFAQTAAATVALRSYIESRANTAVGDV